jgi:hypothetical protein
VAQVGGAATTSRDIVTLLCQWTIQTANAKYRNDAHRVFQLSVTSITFLYSDQDERDFSASAVIGAKNEKLAFASPST